MQIFLKILAEITASRQVGRMAVVTIQTFFKVI